MDFSSRYRKLNAAQKEAVDTIEGPVMVIAGPGTGKTELLSMRVANILRSTDTLPDNILCLTFTDSGADAMRARLEQIAGKSAYKVAIHTFHSFGSEIINQHSQFFYQGAPYKPADELTSYQILHTILDELGHANPLATKNDGEYTHLRDLMTTISELKRSGLMHDELESILEANERVIEQAEPLLAQAFSSRLSKKTIDALRPLPQSIATSSNEPLIAGTPSLSDMIASSLETAINEAEEANATAPIKAWRDHWLKKDDSGTFVLKTKSRQEKLRAAAAVYWQYIQRMNEAKIYDFDDMILRVVQALELFPELRYALQEKYQYILVDEFQDTNLAQMRIVLALTENPANEGSPNIMTVGDDDQAIYSFQGADVGNIHTFLRAFPTTRRIVLTDNYRSASPILTGARQVITLGSDRLENTLSDLDKTLTPHQSEEGGGLTVVELPTIHDERRWLASHIADAIKRGISPSSIAVLARRHHELEALLPYFHNAGVPVAYERQDNILDLEIIRLIEHLALLLQALLHGEHRLADSLLPKLLAHPAFGFTPHDIWTLSRHAHANRQHWMEAMAEIEQFQPLHAWLLSGSKEAAHTPLEAMLDQLVGHGPYVAAEAPFRSPLHEYFFSQQKHDARPDEYLTYLEALRKLRTRLREYRPDQTPTLSSLLELIQLHRQMGSPLSISRPVALASEAIRLMTAHKSKGLEFDTVYVTGAIDSSWGERVRTRSRLISYPENLPLAPSGDTYDERLRLFFVAMTRAKRQLKITYSLADANDKTTRGASFLHDELFTPVTPKLPDSTDARIAAAEIAWYEPLIQPIQPTMRQLIAPMLQEYKLSATHLTAFLDIPNGGPQTFLLEKLLRFPQAMSPHAAFGTAIHATLQRAHAHVIATGERLPPEILLSDFEELLRDQRLPDDKFDRFLQKGKDALELFFTQNYDSFSPDQKVELSFARQGVTVGEALLTGALDVVTFTDDGLIITDYKTGSAVSSWTGKTDYEKIKLHRYRQQLMFYELLVRHSRDYASFATKQHVIQFVEPTKRGEIVALNASFTRDELTRFGRLIQEVYRRITALDLPDTSSFDQSFKGILAFEDWLLTEES